MTKSQQTQKRVFDLIVVFPCLLLAIPIIGICMLFVAAETRGTPLYRQIRIGQNGKKFWLYKIRSMKQNGEGSTVTVSGDPRITRVGRYLRARKLDELPQLFNILVGDMTFVGPRPDVPGYLDEVGDEWSEVRGLKPGLTGPATLAFRNEEELLSKQDQPKEYNDTVIWPKKLELNLDYAQNWTLYVDIRYIVKTALGRT